MIQENSIMIQIIVITVMRIINLKTITHRIKQKTQIFFKKKTILIMILIMILLMIFMIAMNIITVTIRI